MLKKRINVKFMATSAIIAALYVALVTVLQMTSFGPVQVRVAEVLTVLPLFTPAAIPGIFIGCVIANSIGVASGASPLGILDILVGPTASLIAAFMTYYIGKLRRKNTVAGVLLATIPPVVINAFVVGAMLSHVYAAPFWIMVGSVALGQLIACTVMGSLLSFTIITTKAERVLYYK